MAKKSFSVVIFLTIYITLISCNTWFNSYQNPLTISEIASKKDGKRVYIAGAVIRTVPLLKNGAYQLQDSTGKIWILTQEKLPLKGDKIAIKGIVRYQELPLVKEELYLEEIDTRSNAATQE